MKDVTAIVKTFLRDDYLFDCVQSIHSTYPEMQIFVGDDGYHSDEKEAKLKELGATKYIRIPFNVGLSAGRNILVDAVETPYLLLSDDDHLYTSDTHAEYLRTLMDVADIAGGGFLNPEGANIYLSCLRQDGGRFNLINAKPLERYKNIGFRRCDVNHNFFIARTDIVRRIRWDENLMIRYEHEDFFMVAWKQGVRVVHCPDVLLLHKTQGYEPSLEYRLHRQNDASSASAFLKKWGFMW